MADFKHGDVREDGYIFKCYDNGKEHWYSPEAFHRQCLLKAFHNAKHRAKKCGLPFDLTAAHLRDIYPKDGRCPVLSLELEWGGASNNNSPSLDRIDPSVGYVAGNVAFISQRANRLKQDATLDDLERVTNYIRKNLN